MGRGLAHASAGTKRFTGPACVGVVLFRAMPKSFGCPPLQKCHISDTNHLSSTSSVSSEALWRTFFRFVAPSRPGFLDLLSDYYVRQSGQYGPAVHPDFSSLLPAAPGRLLVAPAVVEMRPLWCHVCDTLRNAIDRRAESVRQQSPSTRALVSRLWHLICAHCQPAAHPQKRPGLTPHGSRQFT